MDFNAMHMFVIFFFLIFLQQPTSKPARNPGGQDHLQKDKMAYQSVPFYRKLGTNLFFLSKHTASKEGATATRRGSECWIGNAAGDYKPCSPDLHMQSIARTQLCELSRRWSSFFCWPTQSIIHHRPAKFTINCPVCVLHA